MSGEAAAAQHSALLDREVRCAGPSNLNSASRVISRGVEEVGQDPKKAVVFLKKAMVLLKKDN
jgi:hypothetical protein